MICVLILLLYRSYLKWLLSDTPVVQNMIWYSRGYPLVIHVSVKNDYSFYFSALSWYLYRDLYFNKTAITFAKLHAYECTCIYSEWLWFRWNENLIRDRWWNFHCKATNCDQFYDFPDNTNKINVPLYMSKVRKFTCNLFLILCEFRSVQHIIRIISL
jgi:hypothetical protein